MSSLDQRRLYLRYLERIDSPISLGLALRLKYDESQIPSFKLDPAWYQTPDAFACDYQALCFVKKWKGWEFKVDKKRVAIEAFFDCERRLYTVNRLLQSGSLPSQAQRIISEAQRKITRLLGEFSMFKVDDFGWGPGATATLKGRDATLVHKVREDRLSVTADACDIASWVVGTDIHWLKCRGIDADAPVSLLREEFSIVRSSRLLTVPKDATKDRTIAAEPTMNIFLQKGVGSFFRTRLKSVGIDLDDQTLNQGLAQRAWSDGLATVDLSNASNSVSASLVELLLPPEWFAYLDSLRTKWVKHEGREYRLEMFSSMGNGFTFELESLIFWALASSVTNGTVGVYGDDIIVPVPAVPALRYILSWTGFQFNEGKSFWSGPFRESCGKHYFLGVDVTPLYWKEVTQSKKSVWLDYMYLNAIARRIELAKSQYVVSVLDRYVSSLRHIWLSAVREVTIRHYVPLNSESNDGLAVVDPVRHSTRKDQRGFRLKVLSLRGRVWRNADQESLLALSLRFSFPEPISINGLGVRGEPRIIERWAWFGWRTVAAG